MGGPAADHQPGRVGEARLAGHGGQAVRRCQRQVGEPATRREQARVYPFARLDARPVAGRFDDAGDFLARDERQGKPWEAAAEEPDVPRADARAVDPDQHLSRRGGWVWPFTQLHAIDPAELPRKRYSLDSALLTVCSCCPVRHAALIAEILGLLAGNRPAPPPAGPRPPVEPLSGSELRVLRYLPANLTTPGSWGILSSYSSRCTGRFWSGGGADGFCCRAGPAAAAGQR